MNKGKILALLLLATTCMGVRCGCSGDEYDPCENAPACESTELGTLKLDSASALPFQGQETVTFVNQQGFQAHFKGSGYSNDSNEKYIVSYINACKGCTEHYQKERSSLVFTGTNINFSYTYERIKNTPEETYAQGPVSGTIDDAIAIKLGNGYQVFGFSLNRFPLKFYTGSEVKLHDSLLIGNKFYHQVYEVSNPPTNSASIEPKGIYYTRQQGLVGYYFTNNERWYKL